MFHRSIDDPHQMGFAFSKVLAQVNYMLRESSSRAGPRRRRWHCLCRVNANRIRS
jgi:hypothetical protein